MTGFRSGGWPKQKGPIPQRQLLDELVTAIDAASGRVSSAHRDIARARLNELREANWNTGYILHNLNSTRCKFLASRGWPVSPRHLIETKPWGRKR